MGHQNIWPWWKVWKGRNVGKNCRCARHFIKGLSINDITQIWRFSVLPPPCHAITIVLPRPSNIASHKIQPPLPLLVCRHLQMVPQSPKYIYLNGLTLALVFGFLELLAKTEAEFLLFGAPGNPRSAGPAKAPPSGYLWTKSCCSPQIICHTSMLIKALPRAVFPNLISSQSAWQKNSWKTPHV